jgi:two-component system, NarL family, response regulator NreC
VKAKKMSTIRILILDDQTILRVGLRMLIDAQPDMEVVGEANDSPSALVLIRVTKPDLIVMDMSLPDTSGIQAIKQLRQECPDARVLILGDYDDPTFVRSVLAAGGSGYITKQAAVSDLWMAIHTISKGRSFVDPTLANILLQDLLMTKKAARRSQDHDSRRNLLSPRERQVLILLAQGYTNREVAEQIYVSIKTVETHRARIAQKLELRNRADLTRYARESGLLNDSS